MPRCPPASPAARASRASPSTGSPTACSVLLFPDATKPTTTVNVTYLVGSRHENYGETGMAHLLEHLVFKGTPTIPNICQELGRARACSSTARRASTAPTTSRRFTATDDNLEWALRDGGRPHGATRFIAKADLDTEMTVVRNEFEMGENSPRRVLWKRAAARRLSTGTTTATCTIGARSDVENVDDRAAAARSTGTYYQPDNAVLVVAGKFDPAKTLALIADGTSARSRSPRARCRRLYTARAGAGRRAHGRPLRRVGAQPADRRALPRAAGRAPGRAPRWRRWARS
ncbi:MAG: insulinase family protein [Comamonadaceae bacterium]|nr:insulinase family protein [Comamonadaceae bacterium]